MSELSALVESLHPHEVKVLGVLVSDTEPGSEEDLAQKSGLEPAQVGAALGRLQLKGLVHIASEISQQHYSLTEVGQQYKNEGSPYRRILSALTTPSTIPEMQQKLGLSAGEISKPLGDLKKEGSIQIGAGGVVALSGTSSSLAESLETLIDRVLVAEAGSAFSKEDTVFIEKFSQKRGNPNQPFRIDTRVARRFGLTDDGKSAAGEVLKQGVREEASRLTPEMLKDGSWRNVKFRKYTMALSPPRIAIGKKHPYREFLDLVKAKFVGMGFEEMRGPLVENEFWDMDALYMPQFHPARNIHDVYFVKDPTHSTPIPEPLLKYVQQAHERGWKTGSTGWGYSFDPVRTRRLILRSQGTAVSARTLAQQPKIPGKYFSIARCFRYDQVDATHAPDFYQIEGIVLGADINFRTLLGLLNLFAREVAQAQESRFLPAYFPFTEPSVELHVRHPRLGWMELGGAGLLRPEVTQPLGVDVPVIAWGLGLDRMAMVALEIHDIRDLFSADLEMIRAKPVQY